MAPSPSRPRPSRPRTPLGGVIYRSEGRRAARADADADATAVAFEEVDVGRNAFPWAGVDVRIEGEEQGVERGGVDMQKERVGCYAEPGRIRERSGRGVVDVMR